MNQTMSNTSTQRALKDTHIKSTVRTPHTSKPLTADEQARRTQIAQARASARKHAKSFRHRYTALGIAAGFTGIAFAAILVFSLLFTAVKAVIEGFVECVAATFAPLPVFAILTVAVIIFAVCAVLNYGDRREKQGKRSANARHQVD